MGLKNICEDCYEKYNEQCSDCIVNKILKDMERKRKKEKHDELMTEGYIAKRTNAIRRKKMRCGKRIRY